MDVEHAEVQATGDGEGGLHPLHGQKNFHQLRATEDTPWYMPQDNPGGATGRGSAM